MVNLKNERNCNLHVRFRREKIRQRKSRGRSRYRREDQRVEHVLLVLGKRRLKRVQENLGDGGSKRDPKREVLVKS